VLSAAMPMFSHKTFSTAHIATPDALADDGNFAGIALQNPGLTPVLVRLSVDDAVTSITLLPSEKLVRSADELFPGMQLLAGMTLNVQASAPVQVLGLMGEATTGAVLPLKVSGE